MSIRPREAPPRALPSAPARPLVSVVIPTHRRPELLPRALRTVRAQSYSHWELIVVDDNPPDSAARAATEATLEPLLADDRVRYLRHGANRGGSAARNSGVRAARGDLVAFLDDDDAWLPDKLERQVTALERASADTALAYCGIRHVRAADGRVRDEPAEAVDDPLPRLLADNFIGTTSGMLCRREALLEVGLFAEDLPASQDLDLYIRLCRRYSIVAVPEPLVVFHDHGAARISRDYRAKAQALRILRRRYAAALERAPGVRSRFEFRLGRHHAAAGEVGSAVAAWWRAWLLRPWRTRSLRMLLAVLLLRHRFRSWERVERAVRWRRRRLRAALAAAAAGVSARASERRAGRARGRS